MSYQATVHRVLIASPSDVVDERRAIPEIILQWNRDNGFSLKTILEAVKWETHCTPEMGDRPQEIVNRQVVRDCDILVGVFWTRLGSPTGKQESGTVEEIQEFIATGKPVLLYFSKMPVAPDSLDAAQWDRLKAFRKDCESKGLYYTYDSIDELRDLLRSHLGRTIQKLNSATDEVLAPSSTPPQDEETSRKIAIRSFCSDFEAFLRGAAAEWAAERDSDPMSTDDGKYLLGRIAGELVQYRSRIQSDSGQLSALLADATKRVKSLQRHQVFLDGGVSFNEFWQEGDEILFLLAIVPALLDCALQDEETTQKRDSIIQAAIEELRFNQQQLVSIDYSTAMALRTSSSEDLINATLRLPERLLTAVGTHILDVKAARDVHRTTIGGAGDSTPELITVEQLLKTAQSSAAVALHDLTLFCQYRNVQELKRARGAPNSPSN